MNLCQAVPIEANGKVLGYPFGSMESQVGETTARSHSNGPGAVISKSELARRIWGSCIRFMVLLSVSHTSHNVLLRLGEL